jgi:hypothetical protein
MPFNEALFWFGIAALGVGPFFIFEGGMKKIYGIGLTVVGVLACAYSEYRHYHPEALPQIPFWIIIWVLTWALLGYNIYLRRFRRLPPPPVEKPKEPSKLVIHGANYKAVEGGGEEFQVDDFLRQIISGDSLVFDIENHNFVIGDKNFVPRDPLWGKVKRLQVNYSYRGQPAITTIRHEHSRLVLPEDSAIPWLKGEIDRLKAAQSKQPTYPIPTLRLRVLEMCSELQGFKSAHGHEPEKPNRKLPETQEEFLQRYHQHQQDKIRWGAKFAGDFRLQLLDRILHLRDEVLAKAHIDDLELNTSIETAANDSTGNADAVERIIARFWTRALEITV